MLSKVYPVLAQAQSLSHAGMYAMRVAGLGRRGHRPRRQRAPGELPAAAGAAASESPFRRAQRSRNIEGRSGLQDANCARGTCLSGPLQVQS